MALKRILGVLNDMDDNAEISESSKWLLIMSFKRWVKFSAGQRRREFTLLRLHMQKKQNEKPLMLSMLCFVYGEIAGISMPWNVNRL